MLPRAPVTRPTPAEIRAEFTNDRHHSADPPRPRQLDRATRNKAGPRGGRRVGILPHAGQYHRHFRLVQDMRPRDKVLNIGWLHPRAAELERQRVSRWRGRMTVHSVFPRPVRSAGASRKERQCRLLAGESRERKERLTSVGRADEAVRNVSVTPSGSVGGHILPQIFVELLGFDLPLLVFQRVAISWYIFCHVSLFSGVFHSNFGTFSSRYSSGRSIVGAELVDDLFLPVPLRLEVAPLVSCRVLSYVQIRAKSPVRRGFRRRRSQLRRSASGCLGAAPRRHRAALRTRSPRAWGRVSTAAQARARRVCRCSDNGKLRRRTAGDNVPAAVAIPVGHHRVGMFAPGTCSLRFRPTLSHSFSVAYASSTRVHFIALVSSVPRKCPRRHRDRRRHPSRPASSSYRTIQLCPSGRGPLGSACRPHFADDLAIRKLSRPQAAGKRYNSPDRTG